MTTHHILSTDTTARKTAPQPQTEDNNTRQIPKKLLTDIREHPRHRLFEIQERIEAVTLSPDQTYQGNLRALVTKISDIINEASSVIENPMLKKNLPQKQQKNLYNQVVSLYNSAISICIEKGFIKAAIHFANEMNKYEFESKLIQQLQQTLYEANETPSWLPDFINKITDLSRLPTAHQELFGLLNSLPASTLILINQQLESVNANLLVEDETTKAFIEDIKKHWELLCPALMMSCLSNQNTSHSYSGLPFLIRTSKDKKNTAQMPQYRSFLLVQMKYEQALDVVASNDEAYSTEIIESVKQAAKAAIEHSMTLWPPNTRQLIFNDQFDCYLLPHFQEVFAEHSEKIKELFIQPIAKLIQTSGILEDNTAFEIYQKINELIIYYKKHVDNAHMSKECAGFLLKGCYSKIQKVINFLIEKNQLYAAYLINLSLNQNSFFFHKPSLTYLLELLTLTDINQESPNAQLTKKFLEKASKDVKTQQTENQTSINLEDIKIQVISILLDTLFTSSMIKKNEDFELELDNDSESLLYTLYDKNPALFEKMLSSILDDYKDNIAEKDKKIADAIIHGIEAILDFFQKTNNEKSAFWLEEIFSNISKSESIQEVLAGLEKTAPINLFLFDQHVKDRSLESILDQNQKYSHAITTKLFNNWQSLYTVVKLGLIIKRQSASPTDMGCGFISIFSGNDFARSFFEMYMSLQENINQKTKQLGKKKPNPRIKKDIGKLHTCMKKANEYLLIAIKNELDKGLILDPNNSKDQAIKNLIEKTKEIINPENESDTTLISDEITSPIEEHKKTEPGKGRRKARKKGQIPLGSSREQQTKESQASNTNPTSPIQAPIAQTTLDDCSNSIQALLLNNFEDPLTPIAHEKDLFNVFDLVNQMQDNWIQQNWTTHQEIQVKLGALINQNQARIVDDPNWAIMAAYFITHSLSLTVSIDSKDEAPNISALFENIQTAQKQFPNHIGLTTAYAELLIDPKLEANRQADTQKSNIQLAGTLIQPHYHKRLSKPPTLSEQQHSLSQRLLLLNTQTRLLTDTAIENIDTVVSQLYDMIEHHPLYRFSALSVMLHLGLSKQADISGHTYTINDDSYSASQLINMIIDNPQHYPDSTLIRQAVEYNFVLQNNANPKAIAALNYAQELVDIDDTARLIQALTITLDPNPNQALLNLIRQQKRTSPAFTPVKS